MLPTPRIAVFDDGRWSMPMIGDATGAFRALPARRERRVVLLHVRFHAVYHPPLEQFVLGSGYRPRRRAAGHPG